MGRMDQKTGVRTTIAPTRPAGTAAAALQLDRADRAVAARPEDALRRRAGAVPLARPRRHLGRDQSRSDDQRPDKIGRNVPYCTITSISESPLTAGMIWVGTDDGKVQLTRERRRRVDRPDAGADRGRRARRSLGQPRVRVAARRRHRLRREERVPQRRLRALSVQDDRLRQDLDRDQGQPARRADQRRRPGSPATSNLLVVGQRRRRVRLDRRRRAAGRSSRPTCRPSPCTT